MSFDLYFRLHGIRVHLECEDETLKNQLGRFFEYLGLEPIPPGPAEIETSFQREEIPPISTDEAWVRSPKAGFSIRFSRGELEVRNEHANLLIHPRKGMVRGSVAAERGDGGRLNMNLVSYALLTILRHHDLYPMHGAALALDGRALMIVGDSGCGKSTLAGALLESGWKILSDDSLLLRPSSSGIEALPLRRDLFVLPDRAVPGLENDGHSPQEPKKRRIDIEQLFPNRRLDRCRPRLLVFPEIVDRPRSRLEICPLEESIHLLAHHGLVAEMEKDRARENMEILRDLALQSSCMRLFAGRDLLATPACAAELFETTMRSGPRTKAMKTMEPS